MAALLIAIAWRSLALAALAGLLLARRKSAAARHAVWTLVTAGMLIMGAAVATLPSIPVRVIRPVAPPVTVSPALPARVRAAIPLPARRFPWERLLVAVYAIGLAAFAGRLAHGYAATRRLASGGRRLSRFEGEAVYESERVAVPLTAGWLRPKIFLPPGWEAWPPEKLDAVLIHERNHVRRADWAIAALAGVNHCVFWFHPLAWWLEARLKVLAEEACDDASLAQVGSREFYAEVLIEIAAALRGGGRVAANTVAMAKGVEVTMRVERILDESRQLAPAMTRARWAMLVCCAAPVIYLSAVMRPARVHAQQPPPAVSAPAPAEVGVEEFQANVVQLNSLQRMLEQNREALYQVLQRRVAMESELQNLNSATRAYEREAEATALEDRLRRLQAELATLQETFSPQHPSVRRLQTQLAEIERMRAEMARTSVAEPEKQANLLRAEMQNLNRQMDEKVKQAAEIQRQIAAYQQRVESAHSGTVLTVTFGADGRAEKVRVVHGHGPDQDEKAIEWAKGLRNGQPGPAVVTVEVPVK